MHTSQQRINQTGLTLVEVMIALASGLILILATTGLIVQSKSTQAIQIDLATIQDTASFALGNLSRNIKQAGYINYDKTDAPFIVSDYMSPNVIGFDAKSLKAKSANISQPVASSANSNSSDILAIRFFGSGRPADNTMLNCAGFGEAEPASQDQAEEERAWSIYYVADDMGEPALFCKYRGKHGDHYEALAIARGVESFQVLYGIDSDSPANGISNQFLTATEINALDQSIPVAELNKKTHWKKISAIKVALLLRANMNSRIGSESLMHHLFGQAYSNLSKDKDAIFDEAKLSRANQQRLRKIYNATIHLNNSRNNY